MTSKLGVHGRILDAAAKLFYDDGIAATCVDKVSVSAGVSKPTIYAHFHSKDELVAAVLEHRHDQRVESLEGWLSRSGGDPRERLLSIFDWLADWFAAGGNRGCAFVNACAELGESEHQALEIARGHKHWMRDRLAELAAEAGASDPVLVGSNFMVLIDGANARMVVDGNPAVAIEARHMAEVLLDNVLGTGKS